MVYSILSQQHWVKLQVMKYQLPIHRSTRKCLSTLTTRSTYILSWRCLSSSKRYSNDASSSLDPSKAGNIAHTLRQDQQYARPKSIDTILAHAGLSFSSLTISGPENSPLCPPLELATTFERPPDGNYKGGYVYSRMGNPTRNLLEKVMAELETTTLIATESDQAVSGASCAFSSGMAAISSILLAHPRCHVLLPDDCYHGVPSQLENVMKMHGVTYETVDMSNEQAVRSKLEEVAQYQLRRRIHDENNETKKENDVSNLMEDFGLVLWLETPSNPLTKISDISSLSDIANEVSALVHLPITVAVDSTWSPPNVTQPLLLGADIVVHSGTKYLGGHSDVLLGVLTSSLRTSTGRKLNEAVKQIQINMGAVASPFDCWLTLRGLRSMSVRMDRAMENAMELSVFLNEHPLVAKVHYPGLCSHPGHEVASKQMSGGYGAMLSFEVEDERTAMAVAGAVKTLRRATSLGGTETLIEHRASIEPQGRTTSPPGLLRVSVGLEDIYDLKVDLDSALHVANAVCERQAKQMDNNTIVRDNSDI
mmetsp:Transcript_3103/g.4882  ORF Transcript_3103/g.4882 Transcript_3103/m.4882 type:complete len:537 (+) Transcript_3103:67-1677(+)